MLRSREFLNDSDKVTATKVGDRVAVTLPYHLINTIKVLPTSRWDARGGKWSIVATPWAVYSLAEAFDFDFESTLQFDEETKNLYTQADSELACNELLRDQTVPEETGIVCTEPMWQHQSIGWRWIAAHRASLLYFGMGTGKSRTVLEYALRSNCKRILIVCPQKVIGYDDGSVQFSGGWGKQIRLFALGRIKYIPLEQGTSKKKANQLYAKVLNGNNDAVAVVINYDSFWREPLADAVRQIDWDLIVYDEIHRIKANNGSASNFAARLSMGSKKIVGLSGTPMPHSPIDAFGVFRALDPGLFGDVFYSFKNKYCKLKESRGQGNVFQKVIGYKNQETMNEIFYRCAYHVSDDVLNLPEAMPPVNIEFTLGKSTRAIYEEMEADFITEIRSGVITAANAGSRLMKLRQISSGFAYDEDGGVYRIVEQDRKDALVDVFEDIAPRDPVVVFYTFTEEAYQIAEACAQSGRSYSEVSGRRNDLQSWQEGNADVLAAQIQSGSEGIDCTRAAINIYYSHDWSLGRYLQSRKRTDRPGQTRSVRTIHIVGKQTFDNLILRSLERNEEVIEFILHEMKGE